MNQSTLAQQPAIERIILTTTLNRLKGANACTDRYRHLVKALGGASFPKDEPINLLTILKHNGVVDCLWAMSATAEDSSKVEMLIAVDFAESVLHLYENKYPGDTWPRDAIEAARRCARGEISKDAARAARDAAWDAMRAARDAAGAAAWAAWDAAGTAGTAGDAAIIKRYLKM